MDLEGQDERIARFLKEADAILLADRERGVFLSVETYSMLRQRMRNAETAEKLSSPLKKFTAATDLAIILGAVRRELQGEKSMSGLLNGVRGLLDEISGCHEMKGEDGRSLLLQEAKTEILWEIREAACADQRKFTLTGGELNRFVIGLVMNRAEEKTGAAIPERLRERYRIYQGRASFAFR